MHEIHGGLGFRHNDDLGRKLSLVGHYLVFVFGWTHSGSTGGGGVFKLRLSVTSEPFSLFHHSNNLIVSPR